MKNKIICRVSILSYFLRILKFHFGNLYFKFGSEAGASAFLELYISDLDNNVLSASASSHW
jgi:hypothetical protein